MKLAIKMSQEEGTAAHKQGNSWLVIVSYKGREGRRCRLHGHHTVYVDGWLERGKMKAGPITHVVRKKCLGGKYSQRGENYGE